MYASRDYGWDGSAYAGSSYTYTSLFVLVYVFSFCIIIWVNYHVKVVKNVVWYPETIFTMLFSAIVGAITNYSDHADAFNSFQYELFFYIFIPPVIFFSTFQMNFGLFYKFFPEIFVIANIGTVISALVIGFIIYFLGRSNLTVTLSLAECISFGSLISATDPVSTLSTFTALKVEPVLNVIILGSSIIDDAISVILFSSLNKFVGLDSIDSSYVAVTIITYFIINVVASIGLGIACGLFFVSFVKRTLQLSDGEMSNDLLVGITVSMAYLSFMLATCCQISGIICCLVTSFVFRRYCPLVLKENVFGNMTHVIGSISYLFENLIFMSLGLSITQRPYLSGYNLQFILYTYIASQIGRAAFVYPLSYLLNKWRLAGVEMPQDTSSSTQHFATSVSSTNASYDDNIENRLSTSESNREACIQTTYTKSYKSSDDAAPAYVNMGLQHIIMLAGLRGPISYSSSMIFPDALGNRALIVATTRALIIITILQATPLSYLLKKLKIRTNVDVPQDEDLSRARNYYSDDEDYSKLSFWKRFEMKYLMSYIFYDE